MGYKGRCGNGAGVCCAGVKAAPEDFIIPTESTPVQCVAYRSCRVCREGAADVVCRKAAIVAHYRSLKMRK